MLMSSTGQTNRVRAKPIEYETNQSSAGQTNRVRVKTIEYGTNQSNTGRINQVRIVSIEYGSLKVTSSQGLFFKMAANGEKTLKG